MSDASLAGHPRGLATLFFTEMWERFSYYGMRAILVLAMVAAVTGANPGLGLSDADATAIYGLYTAGVYLLALPGGWIADRLIGQQKAVWYGGILIAAGHFTMAVPTTAGFFIGMLLIVLGTGLLKPNISTIVGELYPEGGARRDAGFSIFYMGINVGAFLGKIACGLLGEKVGWHWGFGLAGIFMTAGLIQYRLTAHHLGEAGLYPSSTGDEQRDAVLRQRGWKVVWVSVAAIVAIVAAALAGALQINPLAFAQGTGIFIVLLAAAFFAGVLLFGGLTTDEKKRVGAIIVCFIAAAVFWSGFEQAGSSLNLFAQRYTDRVVLGWELPASWLQAANPILIIVLSPVFAALWIGLARRNIELATPVKFAIGLIQLAAGFGVMAVASFYVVNGDQVLPTWLLLTYLLHTTGELCVSPVGLSAVTKLAPKRYLGQMMGTWFMGAALGNLIGGLIAGYFGADAVEDMPRMFLTIVWSIGGVGLLMAIFAKPIGKLMSGVR